jgi:BirA family biotin operon repressor/biotin-[acetyl-CoA-carboxylase] ligase
LRREGYQIKATRRRGYRLIQRPDSLSSLEISPNLRTHTVGSEVHVFEEVTSTNSVAYEMGLQGAREGVVVIAESQARGRGRMNRPWISPSHKNLYLSLILRPPLSPHRVSTLTYMGAISTAEALSERFRLNVELKWPNDILLRKRKLAGLLNEVKAETDGVDFVVLGFGVNLNMAEEDFPREIRKTATSVMRELGHRVSRVEFTRCLLERIESWYDIILLQGINTIIEKWEALARIRGRVLELRSFGEVHRGVAEGLDCDGALLLRIDGEKTMRFVSGDLTEVPGG